MLTNEFMTELSRSIFDLLDKVIVIFDDKREEPVEIDRALSAMEPGKVKVLAYLEDNMAGNIEQLKVMMKNGKVGMVKNYQLRKTKAHGTVVAFMLRIYEEEVV